MTIDNTILTYTGQWFSLDAPDPAQVNIEDVAVGLSRECRFGNQCLQFYTVAEHSVRASLACPKELAFEMLMHDAAEAYIGDVIRPLKLRLPDYKKVEKRVEAAVRVAFGFPRRVPAAVKHWDNVMMITEVRDLQHPNWHMHEDRYPFEGIEPLDYRIIPWEIDRAYSEFKARYRALRTDQ